MKLLYLANARLPTEKAHGIQIMKMCEAFAQSGIEVELLVPRRFDDRGSDLYDFYGVRQSFKITRILTIDLSSFGAVGYVIRTISFAIAAFLHIRRVDVVYSRDDFPLALASLRQRPCFFEVHTAKDGFFARLALRRSRGVIFISKGLRDFFETRGRLRSTALIAPDGVDLRHFSGIRASKDELRKEFGLPVTAKIVGYVGKYRTMGKDKGVDALIRIFSKLLKGDPNRFLLLVGIYAEELEEVRAVFTELAIPQENYRIVSHLPQAAAMRYLPACDVLVMNYPDIPHYALFMSPLKLFEYMASGVPIVSTDLPSVREILDERLAVLVPPTETEALCRGIEQVLMNPESAARLSHAARIAVEKHTWHNRAATIIGFLKASLKSRTNI